MKRKAPTFTEQLRRAVETSGMTRYAIAKRTGLGQDLLSRFVHGQTGLAMRTIDVLCECLGLRLVSHKATKGKRQPGRKPAAKKGKGR